MDNKIQEITDKIYQEGVEKGQAEAQRIIELAEAERETLLKRAHQEAEKIVADAKKSSEELHRNTQSELQLYAGRALEALKSEIASLITDSIVNSALIETVDNAWLQDLMVRLSTEWVGKEHVVIQTSDSDALIQYFANRAKDSLSGEVQIEHANGKPATFAIMPSDRGYKVQFGEAEFASYFKDFIRPQLVKLLFN